MPQHVSIRDGADEQAAHQPAHDVADPGRGPPRYLLHCRLVQRSPADRQHGDDALLIEIGVADPP
jgi:hypothetical protein